MLEMIGRMSAVINYSCLPWAQNEAKICMDLPTLISNPDPTFIFFSVVEAKAQEKERNLVKVFQLSVRG